MTTTSYLPLNPSLMRRANRLYCVSRPYFTVTGGIAGLALGATVGLFWAHSFLIGLLFPGCVLALLSTDFSKNLHDILSYSMSKTIQDAFRMAYGVHVASKDMKAYWHDLTWRDFEMEVAAVFRQIGFNATATPGSGDKGVDIVATKNLKKLIIQCKKYDKPVGPNLVRELLGTLVKEGGDLAILIASSGFSNGASLAAKGAPILLLDLDDVLEIRRRGSLNDYVEV